MSDILKLHSDKFRSMKVTLGGTVTAGAMAKIQDTVGAYALAGDSGDEVGFIFGCERITLPKNAGSDTGGSAGAKVYFDGSTKKITAVSSGNTLCGRLIEDADDADTEAKVCLNGDLAA